LGIEGFAVEGLEVLVFELDFFDLFFLEEDAEEVNHQPMMRFELEGEGSKDVYISGGKEAAVTQSRSCKKVCVCTSSMEKIKAVNKERIGGRWRES